MTHHRLTPLALGLAALVLLGAAGASAGDSMRAAIEADWLRQAEAWRPRPPLSQADAAGAVDGVKDGKYAFHTGQEPHPWWQVDLGATHALARVVVFNRLDYAPGLHNADTLRILVSTNGTSWRLVHDQGGRHFGGVQGAPPLEARFPAGSVQARWVRLQIPSAQPVFFHLDEVEVYGEADPARNLALRRPADQSSVSIWSVSKLPAPSGGEVITREAIRHFVERGRRVAEELRHAGVDVSAAVRAFDAAAAALAREAELREAGPRQALYFAVRRALRGLVLQNPALDRRWVFCKRFGQETYPDVCLNHMPWVSRPGGDLCTLTLGGPEDAPEVREILRGQLGPGHVHGMDLSWDGRRIVFGYARTRSNQPPAGWLDRTQSYRLRRTEEPIHLYEIGVDGTGLRQLTHGEWSDLDPTYAPNGDIVFVSERCGTSLQCNEFDKDETSCNLYVIKPDGTGLRRLSVNKDGDYLPHTLDDGTIGYVRWEYHERSWAFIQSIWSVRPDGTQADAIFKQHLVNPWALEDTRSVPGTRNTRLVSVAAGHHTLAAGPVVLVTPGLGLNNTNAMAIVTPGVFPPEGGMDGLPVPEGGVRDAGGFYMHPWPLSEKAFVVAYTYGTGKTGPASEVDPTGYALYLIDVFGTKELLYRDPTISCFHPIPLRARPVPPILPDLVAPGARYATCVVSTVSYGCDGLEPERIKFLRVAEPVGWPYDNERGGQRYGEDHRYGGPGQERKNLVSWTPIRVLGDVPVEADGSARFVVPADTAVYFQALDARRMELRRMRSFISFQPGEQRACTGCHESRAVAPVPSARNTLLAMEREPRTPLPPPWGDQPVSFLRDVQPVLDRHCVRCHSGLKPAGGLDFIGGLITHDAEIAGYGHNRAYETILARGLVSISAVRAQDASITPPLAYGSLKSPLLLALTNRQHRGEVDLPEDDRLRLVIWIDANAPYHDQFVNKRPATPAYDLAQDKTLVEGLAAIHARRCAGCHKPGEVTRLDWIDLRDPDRALFLSAPLAGAVRERPGCGQAVYRDTQDPDYQAVRRLLTEALEKTWSRPRRDLVALEPPSWFHQARAAAPAPASGERAEAGSSSGTSNAAASALGRP